MELGTTAVPNRDGNGAAGPIWAIASSTEYAWAFGPQPCRAAILTDPTAACTIPFEYRSAWSSTFCGPMLSFLGSTTTGIRLP